MNKFNIPDPSNGIKLYWEDLEYTLGNGSIDSGVLQGIEGILLTFGTDFIVSGCDVTGSNIADGWVMLSGNLVRVKAHSASNNFYEVVQETNTTGDRTDNLGGTPNIYEQNRATATAASGNLNYQTGARLADMIGYDITERTFTTNGIYTLLDDEKRVTIESVSITGDILITLPTPSQYNKGADYNFNVNITTFTGDVNASQGAFSITFTGVGGSLIGTFTVRNDGSEWFLVSQTFEANTAEKGIVEKATEAERDAGTADKFIDAELLDGVTGGLKTKIIEIVNWNVDSSANFNVAHGLGTNGAKKIRGSHCTVRSDDDTDYLDLVSEGGKVIYVNTGTITSGNVRLERGSLPTGTNWDSVGGYVRGWLVLLYDDSYIP